NDTLYGGSGEDDYDFDPGFGQDVIYNTGSDYNEIWLYQVNESDVAYAKQGNDLVVSIIGTSDQITVKDWYESPERKVVVYFDDLDITHSIDHIESLATDESSSSNSEPTALADTANTEEDTSIIIDVLANDSDIDGDSLSISSASASYGSVLINGDGTLNYTPNADFNGLDSISYEVSDGNG
ncbi:cadherin-like domain-containing protein, partial [Oleiphilus sp. HI0123]